MMPGWAWIVGAVAAGWFYVSRRRGGGFIGRSVSADVRAGPVGAGATVIGSVGPSGGEDEASEGFGAPGFSFPDRRAGFPGTMFEAPSAADSFTASGGGGTSDGGTSEPTYSGGNLPPGPATIYKGPVPVSGGQT